MEHLRSLLKLLISIIIKKNVHDVVLSKMSYEYDSNGV